VSYKFRIDNSFQEEGGKIDAMDIVGEGEAREIV